MKSIKNSFGFTLIELMIVVAIVGLLAAIAYPSFTEQVRKSRRSDAMGALSRAASAQERGFTENSTYSTSVNSTSPEGYYTITISDRTVNNATSCTAGAYMPCYLLTATATGTQSADTQCTKFYLDSAGVKKAEDNSAADTTTICWAN